MSTETNHLNTETNYLETRLLTVAQFVEEHKFATHGGLRHVIFNSENNGFKKVIKRLGRRVLIDENAFFEWVNEQSGGVNA